ncbi:MAG: serine/threonine-protein kinase [Polyangiaceae bacterium]
MMQAGDRIKDYEIWGRVGGGGMSDVWLARHVTLAVPLIVKTLRSDLGGDEDRFSRLMNEARLMARVRSHRVVRAIDLGITNETPYLVQEYIDGIDVNEIDKRRRRALGLGLPLWFVSEVIGDVAQGLHAAHQTGVIHRDVKPSNVFFSPGLGIKLGDFGIATAKGATPGSEISGTLSFMAPEALRGEPLDRRADIFALGATAYDLRYGRSPFVDEPVAVRARQPVAPVFPPAKSSEEAFFQHVLAKMMSPEAEHRFHDLNEPRRAFTTLASMSMRTLPVTRALDGSLFAGGTKIVCEVGDIAQVRVDGIVSSASPDLVVGTTVGEALSKAAGPAFVDEAIATGRHPLGSCVVTGAGSLPCRKVIHAVSAWLEVSCIARAVQRALLAAEEEGLHSLALPALGTGTAKVSLEASASAQASSLRWHLALGGTRLREVRFVLLTEEKLRVFREVLECVLLDENNPARDEVGLASEMPPNDVAIGSTMLGPMPTDP